jgi:hypothetical protein
MPTSRLPIASVPSQVAHRVKLLSMLPTMPPNNMVGAERIAQDKWDALTDIEANGVQVTTLAMRLETLGKRDRGATDP